MSSYISNIKKIWVVASLLCGATIGYSQTSPEDVLSLIIGASVEDSSDAAGLAGKKGATRPAGQAAAGNAEKEDGNGFGCLDYISSSRPSVSGEAAASGGFGSLDYIGAASGKEDEVLSILIKEGTATASTPSTVASALGVMRCISTAYYGERSGKERDNYYLTGNWCSAGGGQYSMGRYRFSNPMQGLGLPGRITSGFGFRPKFGRMHKGIDIAMQCGDTVYAALSGVVDKVGFEPNGYGNYVVLTHSSGYETRYAHLTASLVTAGQEILEGQPIAISGNTGNSTGPHLHFEARLFGEAFDPLTRFAVVGRLIRPREGMMEAEYGSWESRSGSARNGTSASSGNPGYTKRTYVVRAGDTLESVARKTGVSSSRICSLNMLSASEPLQAGRMLRLR